jgi:hypothetical protein
MKESSNEGVTEEKKAKAKDTVMEEVKKVEDDSTQ